MPLKSKLLRSLAVLAACGAMPAIGYAASAPRSDNWTGVYHCAQGLTGAHLALTVAPDGTAEGLFEFYPVTQNPGVPRGCFEVAGRLDAGGHLVLAPGAWRLRPQGFVSVGLSGQELAGGRLVGAVQGPGCGSFALMPAKPASLADRPSACLGAIS